MVLILLLMSLLIIPTFLFAEETYGETEGKSEEIAGFELTLKDGFISLNAEEATLSEIVEEIGRRINIEVIGKIPEEEKISIEFEKLSLAEALEKLSTSYGYVMDDEKGIAKIIVLPKGKEAAPLRVISRDSEIQEGEGKEFKRLEPFKFEFDPSAFMK